MGRDMSRSVRAREHVNVWRARMARSKALWDSCEQTERRELCDMVGNLRFPLLVFRDENDRNENPQADQYNLNLLLRMLDKYRAHVGDEEPDVKFSRATRGLERVGEKIDRAVVRALAQSGAPDELQESVGPVATEGLSFLYCEIPDFPLLEDVIEGQKGADQIAAEAQAGVAEPGRLQDHIEATRRLAEMALTDIAQQKAEFATTEAGGSTAERVLEAAAEQADAAADEEKAKTPLYWRGEKMKARWVELSYGPDVLWDCTRPRFKDKRWVAIRQSLPLDEAKTHPAFRPSVRSELTINPYDFGDEDESPGKGVESHQIGGDDPQNENGEVVFWIIFDRKYGTRHFIPECCDYYMEKDEKYPYIGRDGLPLFPAVGEHPGFFPLVPFRGKRRVVNDWRKDFPIPLLMPGLQSQKILTKIASYHLRQIRTHTSVAYEHAPGLDEDHLDALRRNDDGALIEGNPELWEQGKPSVVLINKGKPSDHLRQALDSEIARFSILMNFPLSELTSQPVADTATQEQMAMGAGNLGIFEVLRTFEVSYAHVAYFQREIMRRCYPKEFIEDLVGKQDAEEILMVWEAIGVSPELPVVRIAARARDQQYQFLRAKQALDLHERAKAELEPLSGLPRVDSMHILQEASKVLGFGELPKLEISQEERFVYMKAKLEMAQGEQEGSGQPGESTRNGKVRDSQGAPRGRRERAGRRDTPAGRDRGVTNFGDESGRTADMD